MILRETYEVAISRFVGASVALYRHDVDGTAATPEEIAAFEEAAVELERARSEYRQFVWHRSS